jgi:YEATS domain-containing protein 4
MGDYLMNPFKKSRSNENTVVACPIVYGSIAHWMGRKADEFATHKWTLYVRGPNGEDLSTFVSRVVFTLHSSFAIPLRGIINSP